MLKKVLLTIIAVLVAGGALMLYGTHKAADEFVKANEPQLRQYIQLDEAAQNKYVIEHADDILAQAEVYANPDEKADVNLIERIQQDPAVQKALADLGRAILAAAIMHSDSIAQDLSDTVKAQYQKESDELKTRLEKYADVFAEAQKKIEAVK